MLVAIADLRASNRERAFQGDPNDDRIGLVRKLGAGTGGKVKAYDSHKALLAAKDELGLEAVVIAVPLSEHYGIARPASKRGCMSLRKADVPHDHAVQRVDPPCP